jgi:hypothetical protein
VNYVININVFFVFCFFVFLFFFFFFLANGCKFLCLFMHLSLLGFDPLNWDMHINTYNIYTLGSVK